MKEQISAFCARIGADLLLVQAGGGNVSWKDGDTLHVKASGVWLSQALERTIFLPVDMAPLRAAFAKGDYDAATRAPSQNGLRPSIETALHALMPHRIVAHVHSVEALSHLVRRDCERRLADLLGEEEDWALVPYCKPGAELARGVAEVLATRPQARLIFLQNHGVIIGGESVAEVEAALLDVCARLASPLLHEDPDRLVPPPALDGLIAHDDPAVHILARDPSLFEKIGSDWALYPDHVVFLGARAQRVEPNAPLDGDIAFVRGLGVYGRRPLSPSQAAYLNCYAQLFRRLPLETALSRLTDEQAAELLNWDLEKYRQNLAGAQAFESGAFSVDLMPPSGR